MSERGLWSIGRLFGMSLFFIFSLSPSVFCSDNDRLAPQKAIPKRIEIRLGRDDVTPTFKDNSLCSLTLAIRTREDKMPKTGH